MVRIQWEAQNNANVQQQSAREHETHWKSDQENKKEINLPRINYSEFTSFNT